MKEFSERKETKLCLDNYKSFIPKKLNLEKKLDIDLQLLEESDEILDASIQESKSKEAVLRKESLTNSTSLSKQDEISDCSSLPTPTNKNTLINNLFGNKNSCSNPVSNYFLGTDSYFKEILPEGLEYNKTENYITKEKYFKENFELNSENNLFFSENQNELNSLSGNIPTPKDQIPPMVSAIPFPAQMNEKKGKFDMPVYYFGYYAWDGKLLLIFI